MKWMLIYLSVFAVSCAMGAAATWLARAAGLKWDLLDKPGGRKNHARPIATTGGWGVYAAFALLAGGGGLLGPLLAPHLPASLDPLPRYLENLAGVRSQLLAILAGLTLIFAVGAVDDLRPLGPRFKLFAQILAVVPLIVVGITIKGFLPGPLGAVLTVLWCVGLMNSFNFLDNMDGVCATVAGIIALVLAIAAALGGQLVVPALFVCFAGILFGFLFFNFNPASIFLGDSGALTIGYLMGVFSIMTTYYAADQPTGLPVLTPLAVMGVPLFDTISVMLIRWRNGAPFMVGDNNHFTHRLRAIGLSVRQTALTVGALTAAIGLASLALRHLAPVEAALHLLALVLLFGVIAAIEFAGRQKKS